ncbi:MAG TPA: hypothetical protein VFW24_06135 [Acidimicrobiales bacterium]|nr:hypothetical protein [Acidimicrobiales bacterium]
MAGGPVSLTTAPPAVPPADPVAPRRWRLDPLALAAVAVPTVVLAVVAALDRIGPWGDQGAIQLATDRAGRFSQLVGPYSRFGWSHPGPLWFYLLAGPYRLFGGTGRGLAAATVVVTGVAALAAVAVVARLGGAAAGRWAAVVVVAQLAALGPATVAEVWNPAAIIVPTALFLVFCAGLAVGRWWMLAGAVGAGGFLVQTDVSTGLVVAVVGLVALVSAAVRGRFARSRSARTGREVGLGIGVAAGLAVVVWLPALVQQLTGSPGNLSRVVRFFRSGPGPGTGLATHHPFGPAARSVAGALWPPLRGRLGAGPPGPAATAVILLGALALAAVAVAVGTRRGRHLGAALGGAGGLAVVVGVVSATRATGPLYAYLTEWLSGAGAVIVLGLVLALTGERGQRSGERRRVVEGRRAGAAAVLAAVALVALAAVLRPPPPAGGAQADALFAAVLPTLPPAGPDRAAPPVEVAVATPDRWPWAAGLLVDLGHHGYRPVAQANWLFLFGSQLAYSGHPAATVSVWTPGSGPRPPGRQVAVVGRTAVFVSSS